MDDEQTTMPRPRAKAAEMLDQLAASPLWQFLTEQNGPVSKAIGLASRTIDRLLAREKIEHDS